MRWNATCTLVEKTYTPDSEGVPQPTVVKTEVFCNEFSIGANTWSSMYEIGISADAEIQVWSDEYSGQLDVILHGKYYSVERVQNTGDFTRLTLRHQQSDGPEDEQDDGQDGDNG